MSQINSSDNYTLIDGIATADELLTSIELKVKEIKNQYGITPGIAVILVGDDQASQVYVNKKVQKSETLGIKSVKKVMPRTTKQEELLAEIKRLNNDSTIDGILVQLPLPKHINENEVLNTIHHSKDVDGFHTVNAGKLFKGLPTIYPCTPLGSLIMLKKYVGDLTGKLAVVLGRSNIVGKPMGQMLLGENCTVIQAHSRSKNLKEICQLADILVVAVGIPELVNAQWLKKDCVIIDVGINAVGEVGGKRKLVGDVNFADSAKVASAITPVPGGAGPMTIACLMLNCLKCACMNHNLGYKDIDDLLQSMIK